MSFKEIFKDIVSSFVGGTIIEDVKQGVKQTMDDVEKRTIKLVNNIIKSFVVVSMILLGMIFALVGFSKYLSETVGILNHGIGYVIVGAGLILLAAFAKLMQKD